MKFLIETHGCKLNTADSQAISNQLINNGYQLSKSSDTPDLFILNSCTVTHVADKKARQALNRARRQFPKALVVAAGCYPEKSYEDLDQMSSVDLVVPNTKKNELVSIISSALGHEEVNNIEKSINFNQDVLLGRTRASIKIQEGCDQVCAYCIVPKVRGRERSISKEKIINNINFFVDKGCPEIILTGTQLGSYGFDLENTSLTDLIKSILNYTDVKRLRISSIQPSEFSEELLSLWNNEGKGRLCQHFHIPLQSGSNKILKAMRRTYTKNEFIQRCEMVKMQVPDSSITTDIICGFPGEDDYSHKETKETIEKIVLSDAHVFSYSMREGTSAFFLKNQVDPKIKSKRSAELRDIIQKKFIKFRKSSFGKTKSVLWEGKNRNSGLTDNYIRVKAKKEYNNKYPFFPLEEIVLEKLENNVVLSSLIKKSR
ncbi:MAG: tRNA (N(6)-L-threonylcarbamoyladenosine(37)-C(2))-methylthiotransferase MtaB [Chloroflexi bacterium]|nr:tRNA (N(6)-L-threonylcarbamoyladenosine(37)-C(2))-methylthiotransferase MtaB [Chloroflexota bacterium]|tara:strand:- start:18463 stop:19752 length:1290 start_codon:yes stop_codon:yes gene_type:complete